MRILSLHYPLPNAQIDNKDIFNAPSLFEYDAIIFHPLGFEQSIFNWLNGEEEFYTASGEKVVQEPSGNNARNIDEILEQRRNEIDTFLKRDGILIAYTVPEMTITAEPEKPVVVQGNIFSRIRLKLFPQPSKKDELDVPDNQFSTSRYFLFSEHKDIDFSNLIIAGSGFQNMSENDFNFLDSQIFQNLLRNHANKIFYQGYFDQKMIDHASNISTLLTTAKSKIPIAILIKSSVNKIAMLPNFAQGNTDEAMAEARSLVDDIQSIMNK